MRCCASIDAVRWEGASNSVDTGYAPAFFLAASTPVPLATFHALLALLDARELYYHRHGRHGYTPTEAVAAQDLEDAVLRIE